MAHNGDMEDLDNNLPESDSILKKKLDTEFPLSGGETEQDWEQATKDTEEDDIEEDDTEEDTEDAPEFKRRLDTEFPLSGGEPGE